MPTWTRTRTASPSAVTGRLQIRRHIVGHYSLADFGKLAVKNLGAGKPLVVNDNLKELAPEEAATFQNIGIGATICMPLVKEGRLTALMAIHHKDPHVWTANELALITEVTERSWAHIERVRSEAEVREGEQRFRAELETKVAERTAAFQQSEKTIRTMFETSYMNQGLLTPEGKIVYVNATSLASIKSRLEDVVGKDFWETPWFTGTPGMPEKVREGIARVAAGESIQIAMPLNMPTGNRIYEFSMRPALDETGKVIALVPEAVEITARVRAEQALQQAQKLEAIGNLTGGIAHDFNNLLMAVLGSLELLRKRLPDDASLLRLVDNATEGARRGKSLTERMLAFARKQELEARAHRPRRLISGMVELMERALGPTITVDIQIGRNLPQVEIDPNQLEAALLNLAVNARDAMHGEGPLVISAREEVLGEERGGSRPGSYVFLSVTDAGRRYGRDYAQARDGAVLYNQRHRQGHRTRSLDGSRSRRTVRGHVDFEKFARRRNDRRNLAACCRSASIVQADEPPRPMPSEPAKVTARLSILVVDDDLLILMNTVDMLEDLGHSVVAASSGQLALQRLKEAKFDLMITDHAMPHMTGMQLIKEAVTQYPELAVILATGYAELPTATNIDAVRLRKPYSQAELAEALSRFPIASRQPANNPNYRFLTRACHSWAIAH